MFDDGMDELARTRQMVEVLRSEAESLREEKIVLLAQLNFAIHQVNAMSVREAAGHDPFGEDTLVDATH
jgi:hypothetical protein